MPVTKDAIAAALSRAFLAEGTGLRNEDAQKVRELAPLFVELERLLPRRGGLHVVDACSGKSVVGVLLAALVLATRTQPSRVTALERDPRARALCERAARALDVEDRVSLVSADVADAHAWPKAPDLVVALHACGVATDTILDRGIAAGARRILAVPCCYGAAPRAHAEPGDEQSPARSIPGQRLADTMSLPLSQSALVGRRFAQAIIDAERTLRLEAAGYHTEVVELFPPTVSPFCLAWRARLVDEPTRRARAACDHAALVAASLSTFLPRS